MSQSKNKTRLLAIDPSLRQSGWALFYLEEDRPLAWGTIVAEQLKDPLPSRLDSIHSRVESLFVDLDLSPDDYLVCEGPAPVTLNPSGTIKVEQVRSMFETIARTNRLIVPGRLNPRTVQTELLGLRGRQLPRAEVKKIAESVVYQLFPMKEKIQSQDAIDAILIGVLARNKILHAHRTGAYAGSMFEGGAGKRVYRSGRGMRWSASSFS